VKINNLEPCCEQVGRRGKYCDDDIHLNLHLILRCYFRNFSDDSVKCRQKHVNTRYTNKGSLIQGVPKLVIQN
jgi:hypothetical protein